MYESRYATGMYAGLEDTTGLSRKRLWSAGAVGESEVLDYRSVRSVDRI
jgi:hypothetical protein